MFKCPDGGYKFIIGFQNGNLITPLCMKLPHKGTSMKNFTLDTMNIIQTKRF